MESEVRQVPFLFFCIPPSKPSAAPRLRASNSAHRHRRKNVSTGAGRKALRAGGGAVTLKGPR